MRLHHLFLSCLRGSELTIMGVLSFLSFLTCLRGSERAYDAALEIAGGDERIADAIMSKGCEELDDCEPEDRAEQGWKFQRMRGLLASKLGYTSVEMLDEHGTTVLFLPGCRVEVVE